MTTERAASFLLFAVVAAITPGPSNIMLATAGANAGVLGGLGCLLGVGAGMGLMMFVVPLGLATVVLQAPVVLEALNWCGVAFLLWLSWKIATSRPAGDAAEASPVGFAAAALFQWINPKSWLVSASAAGAFLTAEGGGAVSQAAALAGLFVLAALPSGFVWLAFGAAMQRLLATGRRRRAFNVAMGVLLALSVAFVVW